MEVPLRYFVASAPVCRDAFGAPSSREVNFRLIRPLELRLRKRGNEGLSNLLTGGIV